MMRRLIYSLAVFGTLIFSACNDDEVTTTALEPKTEPKLDYYVESFDVTGLGFKPQMKVEYEYNDSGKISKYTVFTYHPDPESLEELQYFLFTYANNRVDKIKGYWANGNPSVEYSYEYLADGSVSKIKENNYAAGINSEANFSYDTVTKSVKVSYTYSNGGSFEYEFDYDGENILSDKTTRGSQVCSDGEYTYDEHINPFKALGYVDYALTNFSANNKLTEVVEHIACSFPTWIPESYAYEYDERGYPTLVTTFYNSGSTVGKSQKEIFYK